MSHPSNPDNLPMRGATPIECAYDVLAVRWWFWTDPCPRGPRTPEARGLTIRSWGADLPFAEAARRLRDFDVYSGNPAGALELALALACGDER
jgi:hypothetical protein